MKFKLIKALSIFIFIFLSFNVRAQKNIDSLQIVIQPYNKQALFTDKRPIVYKAYFKNRYTIPQEGALHYTIKNQLGEAVFNSSFEVKVMPRKTFESKLEIPFQQQGNFTIEFLAELTSRSAQLSSSFSYTGKSTNKDEIKPNPYEFTSTLDNIQTIAKAEDVPPAEEAVVEEEHGEGEEEEGEIVTKIIPKNKDGVFWDTKSIVYDVELKNTYKTKQEGTLNFIIKTDKGEVVREIPKPVKIAKKGKTKLKVVIPGIESPGIYGISAALNLTTYDDTTKHAFGFKPSQISTPYHKPPDFEEFWDKAKADLAAVDPQYTITLDEEYSTRFHKAYKVEMNSLEGVRIFGWLTIPRLPKKFPVIVGLQGYRVELPPLFYDNYVGFNLNTRGIEKNWQSFNPENEQPLLINIADKDKFVYRGIYMDCVRAFDFIFSHAEMGFDLERVLVFGGSQGGALSLVTAALTGNRINSLIVDNPIFCDFYESYNLLSNKLYNNFPMKHIVDYAKDNPPLTVENLLDNLSYYEVQNFMPNISCSILFAVSLLDPLAPPATLIAAYNKLRPSTLAKSEMYVAPNLGHEVTMQHRFYQLIWMNEKLVQQRKNISR